MEKYKYKLTRKIMADESFMPYLTIKQTFELLRKLEKCISIEKIEILIKNFIRINSKNHENNKSYEKN